MFKFLCSLAAALSLAAPLSCAAEAQQAADYGRIPLTFEANQGQTASQVKYLARGGSYTLFLTLGEAVVRLRSAAIRMQMIGASADAEIQPEEPLAARSNYFVGLDASKWRTGVRHFGRVRYRGVYPGIDVVYYGNQRELEYDIVVAPGADPDAVRFAVEGARRMRVDAQGNLVISTAAEDLIQHRPRVYQNIGGREVLVGGRYRITRGKYVSFVLNRYDKRRPLVIDPALSYATYLGGSGSDTVSALAVDSAGNAYVAGTTTSIDFPTTAGAYDQACGTDAKCNAGNGDIFLAKVNPTGTALVYSTYIGGSATQGVAQVMVDGSGNAYLRGQTSSPDFPITAGAYDPTYPAQPFAVGFLLKVAASGSQLLYSTYVPFGITAAALGPGGSVYTLGNSFGATATPGAFQSRPGAIYVASLNAAGTALNFGTFLDGSGNDFATAIAVDPSGNAVVTGTTTSLNFPVTAASYQPAFPTGASSAGFVAKLNASGTALVFGTYAPGSTNNPPASVALDSTQNVYVATSAGVWELDPTGSSLLLNAAGQSGGHLFVDGSDDVFLVNQLYTSPLVQQVQKVTSGGIVAAFSTSLPVPCCGYPLMTAMDSSGNLYLAANIFPPFNLPAHLTTPGALQPARLGASNVFLAKITPGGGSLRAFPPSITRIVQVTSSPYGYGSGPFAAAWLFSDGSPYGVDVPATAAPDSAWISNWPSPSWSAVTILPESRLDTSGQTLTLNLGTGLGTTTGTYNGNVIVTSPGASNSPFSIPVSLKVTNQPFATFGGYPPLAFQYTIGGSVPQPLTTYVATPNGNVSFTVTPSAAWLSASPQSGSSGTYISVNVNPAGLAEGSYLATLDLKTAGMPTQSLPVRLIVTAPQLAASPTTVAFTQTQGGASPVAQNLSISGVTGSYSATVTGGGAWLNVSPLSGAMPGQLSISVNGSGLQAGTYRASIAISAAGATTVNVPVTFVVVPPNSLTLSTTSLAFSYWPGSTAPAQTVSIGSDPPVNWTAFATTNTGGNWLSIQPTGGSTPGTLSVSVNASGLAVGNYTGSVSVVAPGTANTPQTISVTLAVTASQPASVTPTTLTFSTSPGLAPASQTLAIASGSGKSFTATASSTGNWLSVSPDSGPMPGTVSVSVNPGGLSIGTYSGSIAISITQQDNSVVALTVPVTLSVIAPNPMTVSPSSINVTSWPGAPTSTQQISVSMTTAAVWSCTASVTWLSCPGGIGSGSISLYVYGGGLAPGQYTGTATFTSTGTSNGPQTVTIHLTVLSAAPLTAAPTSLSFKYYPGGPAPASQSLSITAANATSFSVSTSVGTGNPNWFSVTPSSGTTPASLIVTANPSNLSQGYFYGTITLTFSGGTINVPVNLTIGPQLSASVASVSLTTPVGGAAQTSSPITVSSTTQGTPFTVTTSAAGAWLSVSSTSGTAPGSFYVTANPAGLAAGVYTGSVNISATGAIGTVSIPVTFAVTAPSSPTLTLNPAALSFSYEVNGAPPSAQSVSVFTSVLAVVNASTTAANWLSVTPGYGQAPGAFSVSVSPSALSPGVYAGFVTFTASGTQQNVPVTLSVTAAPQLLLSASSLSFAATPGGSNPPAQSVQVTSTGRALSFQTTTSAAWLHAAANSSQTPGTISVSADATNLTAGTYSGTITVSAGSASSQTIGVTLVVSSLPLLTASPAEIDVNYTAGGELPAPQPVVLFSGAPLSYTLKVTSSGWLSLSHSSGTLPDLLEASFNPAGLAPGVYQGSVQVIASGASNSPQTIAVKLTVNAAPPLIYSGGVVNAASLLYGPVAPGEVIAILGENFTQMSQSANGAPWPSSLAGVTVTINGIAAPLLTVTPGEIEAQIPFGIANGMAAIVVNAGGQSSTPEMVPVQAVAPGIFGSAGSATPLQNADFSTNSEGNPAARGSAVIAYVTGQGALNGTLAAGAPSPSSPLLTPVLPVRAILDDTTPATVLFAGMAPGQVGVMQVNLTVPNLPDGEHMLKITVGGVESNSVPLFVSGGSQ